MDAIAPFTNFWPLVSVVVPVYNGEALLPTLLTSLTRLDYPAERLEVLLVNNNSTDHTAELLAETPYTIVFEERPGCGTARNAGIRQAKGEFIACTDADCVLDPLWIKDLLAGFTDGTIGAVAGTIEPYELNHPVERYEALRLNDPGHRSVHVFLPTACTANVMYRAEVFRCVGLLLDRSGGEETDLNWRMQTRTAYRIHFLTGGGLVRHRYRSTLKSFCRSQRYKARTLVDLHRRWNLHIPTGRKELWRTAKALFGFLPKVIASPDRPSALWEAWLDIVVPWTRFRGIREGWKQTT
ncbi:glycosyltransferase [Gloeobacter kilaueensis]|uniref:Glycosyl transferase family 2 n=1 Tax=Gloeobacter kilaueensis (strain ATCC BAA-2537 / CCAP 1431/1 / ULC 316 / JS1) TaxID=1183438 RepID=U5QGA8_GLOK1|nr:glycosyltransferase [Gloeobacter kilaueensis]AGY56705.1 glycosyl transferase family 2 [Gloeobacter kilaueensis JS1]